MKQFPLTSTGRFRRGMTLIELTVVIAVLLLLVTILFVGATAWKRGANRSGCILQIRQVQMAVRSYANLHNHNPGDDVSPANLQADLIGSDLFIETAPTCPGAGLYSFGGNIVPTLGDLYMTCSLDVDQGHVPTEYSNW